MSERPVTIVEYTDPAAAWAWGSSPKLRKLEWQFGHLVEWRRVMGGMVEDLQAQAAREGRSIDPRADAAALAAHWAQVSVTTGMPYPSRLRSVFTTTKMACLAVKAAERQGPEQAARVLRRLQEWLFVLGEPFDTTVSLVAAISGVPDLDVDAYVAALSDPSTLADYQRDWDETRKPNPAARNCEDEHPGHGRVRADGERWRYAFPTLVISGPAGTATVCGWRPEEDYLAALESVLPGAGAQASPEPSTDEVIARHGTATDTELMVICGPHSSDPADAIGVDWGGGMIFCTPDEARSRGLEPATA